MILIDGKKYKVTEDLGFVQSRGALAKAVQTSTGERIALKRGGRWEFAESIILPGSRYTGAKTGKNK